MKKFDIPNTPLQSGNFWYLFSGLLLTLVMTPFHAELPGFGRYSMTLLFSVFMLVAVWSLSASRMVFRFGGCLVAGISCAVGIKAIIGDSSLLELMGLGLMLVFCGLSCYIAARNVFVMHRVDLNSLVGAFCVYLLLGVIWALLYRLVLLFDWGAFSGNITTLEQQVFPDLLYFSFVTLASLGYGDIIPVGNLPKTLAYLEAVTGQFYLAVMVASLVSAYNSGRNRA